MRPENPWQKANVDRHQAFEEGVDATLEMLRTRQGVRKAETFNKDGMFQMLSIAQQRGDCWIVHGTWVFIEDDDGD